MEKVKEREMLPGFRLQSIKGNAISPADYRAKKNLALLFFDAACISCRDILDDFARRYDDYQDAVSEVLVIGKGSMDEVLRAVADKDLPFPVLVDTSGEVLNRFADTTPAVIVADRFGEIRIMMSGDDIDASVQDRILDRLNLIELECPECGVPTWTT